MSNKTVEMIDEVYNTIKETIEKVERKHIELESDFKKNNDLILKELRDLLWSYKVTFKCVSLV